MPSTDPIADMLTRIRNAVAVRHDSVTIPTSKLKLELARILKQEGFIEDYETPKGQAAQSAFRIYLSYRNQREPAITGLRRISKPGLRVYVQKTEIPRYYGGLGVAVLSTSQGVMTGRDAWRKGLGGELLCHIW